MADMKDLAWCFVAGPDFRPTRIYARRSMADLARALERGEA